MIKIFTYESENVESIGSALCSIGTIAGGILAAQFFLEIANQVKEFVKEEMDATALIVEEDQ